MINNTFDMPTGLAARRKLCPNFKLCPRKNLEENSQKVGNFEKFGNYKTKALKKHHHIFTILYYKLKNIWKFRNSRKQETLENLETIINLKTSPYSLLIDKFAIPYYKINHINVSYSLLCTY